MHCPDDTIAAIASPLRGGRRGIVRLSGPQVEDCIRPWFEATTDWERDRWPQVISGSLRLVHHHRLPSELYLWPTERSYTRQPTAEFHTLGSVPLLQRVLENFCQSGARGAEPGEFTLRAFLAGRLDLPQAEAVLGIIDARSPHQLQVALQQLAGGLSRPLHALRSQLLDLCADLEAGLDFVEEDIEFVGSQEIAARLFEATSEIASLRKRMQQRRANDEVPRVTLLGSPNVGKSSLLNALTGDSAALVSTSAGTTRDYVTCFVDWDSIACELVDTAGKEEVTGVHPSGVAQQMTHRAHDRAQLRLFCLDASRPLTSDEAAWLAEADREATLFVWTKCDLPVQLSSAPCDARTSCQAGQGIMPLRQQIVRRLIDDQQLAGETVAATATRCASSLRESQASLHRALRLAAAGQGDELVAAELRGALDQLGQVVGVVYTDDVLDRVFSRFCIGK